MSRQLKPPRIRRLAAAFRGFVADESIERCPECKRVFMCPIEWETDGEHHWLVASRCGECGTWREDRLSNFEAERYDVVLARQTQTITRALRALDRQRMQAEVDAFVAALEHDLIDVEYFAR